MMTHSKWSLTSASRQASGVFGRLTLAGLLLASASASAFVVNITPVNKTMFLQVGVGTMTGGNYSAGGVPGDNPAVNLVSVTIPAANLGNGTAAMITNSTVANSAYDGRAFCTIPTEVYVAGFHRAAAPNGFAALTASVPANLTNVDGSTIPFDQISWVSGPINDPTPAIPSGTFAAGAMTQLIYSMPESRWIESCLRFNYANTQQVQAGTYTGRVTYTLTAP